MKKNNFKKTILFAGGETAGPVTPLLAIAEHWIKTDGNIVPVFIDVNNSVAQAIVPGMGYGFKKIIAGKLRRYISYKTMFLPLQILIGFVQSFFLILKHKPILVMGASGYVQFPVVLAAWILRVPSIIHQQDVMVSLTNKISAPFANKITCTFEKSLKDFSQGLGFSTDFTKHRKVVWTGNPARKNALQGDKTKALKHFSLDPAWPTLLVMGGGSGAAGINHVIEKSLFEIVDVVQVLHSVGKRGVMNITHPRYHQQPFIDPIGPAYAAADIVISRAGIGSITELSELHKQCILIPMPDSHQEANAELLYSHKAAIVLDQADVSSELLIKIIRKILFDKQFQRELESNIGKIMPENANDKMIAVINEIVYG